MKKNSANSLKRAAQETVRFFAPERTIANKDVVGLNKKVKAIVIPTYGPSMMTYALLQSLLNWHPDALIVVVDDATPATQSNIKVLEKITILATVNKNLTFLRSEKNQLKAGALNKGIDYLMNLKHKPDVIFTFDDDVIINRNTLNRMVATLFSDDTVGAVCSEVRVTNKDKNILTRLQALEYHNFNITKIADNGFLKGPLVMQGMLSGFRTEAMKSVKGFTRGHLIEDYDITARLKNEGWKVKIAIDAVAWTEVPESIETLWKQRVRWISGGLQVLGQFSKRAEVVYQDLVGHMLFLSLFLLIILSFFFLQSGNHNTAVASMLFVLSLFNFFVAFIFNVVALTLFKDADVKDWAIKFSIIPELIYSNILSFILLGSYIFVLYNAALKPLAKKISLMQKPYNWGLAAFNKAGFSSTWGTRS